MDIEMNMSLDEISTFTSFSWKTSLKVSISWDIRPCRPVKVNRHFEHIISILKVEMSAKRETKPSSATCLLHAALLQP
jgi:hypothetical protein